MECNSWSGDNEETERHHDSTDQQHIGLFIRSPQVTAVTAPPTLQVMNSRPARTPQYMTAFAAGLGGFMMGTVLGYSAPAGAKLIDKSTDDSLHLTPEQNSWFSSIMNVGALAGGPVGGWFLNTLGRRGTMMASVPPFIVGWILIGGGFQLMMTVGTLYTYGLGAVVSSWRWLAGLCIIPLVLHFILMFFAKESPRFLLFKGKEERAAAALQHFRGKDAHIQTELDMIRSSVREHSRNKASFSDLGKSYVLKPFFISLSLVFFQQFSGVNGVLFNLTIIFSTSGSTLSDDVSSLIVSVVQVITTFFSTILMDKAGRKVLLIVSSSLMALSLVALGEFFYMKTRDETWAEQTLGWLPLLSLMVFVAAFAIGYGPIPSLMMGELLPPNVRELAASQVIMLTWTSAFVVTFIFVPLQTSVGDAGVYFIFAGLCVLSLVFCVTVVPETKGKTLEEITASFGGPPLSPSLDRRNASNR